uniref:Uncharacterized protein n=1 Tax=Parascaris equorum TaxID=6256 RepID=A0A914RDY4_PAREQ
MPVLTPIYRAQFCISDLQVGAMSEEDNRSPIFELVQFLEPHTRIDVRRSAIAYVIGLSAADEGPQLFKVMVA